MRQEHITSRQNPLLVHIRKLQASRSYRKASGEFAAEGTKLLEEAGKMVSGASHGRLPRGIKIM